MATHKTGSVRRSRRRSRPAIIEGLERRVLLAGDGLQATYFPSAAFAGPSYQHLDPQVHFDWRHTATAPLSVQWTGRVLAPVSGRYYLTTNTTGLVRLAINGQTVLNDQRDHHLKIDRAAVDLVAGQSYAVELDWAKGKCPAFVAWSWQHRGHATEVVPMQQLYSGPPAAPSALQAQQLNPALTNLVWQNNADNATAFLLMRSLDGAGYAPMTVLPASATAFNDTQSAGRNVAYQVLAIDVSGQSAPSNAVSVNALPPGTPISLDATGVSGTEIDLSWQDGLGNGVAYYLQRSSDGGQTFVTIAGIPAPITHYRDAVLSPNTNYTYRLLAANDAGASAFTYPITANTLSSFAATGHPDPTQLGGKGWQFTQLPTLVLPDSQRPGNIFYVGQPISFTLEPNAHTNPGNAQTYEVRDYYGNLVDSGAVPHPLDLTLAPENPGWYKLYLYGAPSTATATFGDVVGGTTFSVFRSNPNFPDANGMRAGGYDYQPTFTRIDPEINFLSTGAWLSGSPDPTQIAPGPFAASWTGQLRPTQSASYTLSIAPYGRMWLNGQEVIDAWSVSRPYTYTVSLAAGQSYDIRIDYYHTTPVAQFGFSWKDSTQTLLPFLPVPQTVLYSSAASQALTGDGLSGVYYSPLLASDGINDQVVRAITGMGLQRYAADASNPTASIQQLSADIAFDSKYYVPGDPQRPRGLLIAFPNGSEGYLSGVTQIVQQFQNQVEYWEPRNEPNDAYRSGADFVPVMRDFYNTVKAVNPNLKVIGPDPVSIGSGLIPWLDQFFAAGGGQYIDALSFHAYNSVNRDLTLTRESFAGLRTLLAKYGLSNIPLWQTEQGYMAAVYGAYEPENQAEWSMFEQMMFEQNGIPKEQNVLWYDVSHGFWDEPMFWENADGSLNPAAPLMRVWSEELYGTNFTQAYDFGPAGNNTYIGSLFTGPGKSVAAFMTGGASDGQVTLNVSGGSSLHLIDPFGNASDIPVVNGQATLNVGLLPEYVELASGQSITVVPLNWGPDLATQPGVTASASGSPDHPLGASIPNSLDKIHDGILQEPYYTQQPTSYPWMGNNPAATQAWVELDLPSAQSIDHVVVRCPTPWQNDGSLLDYELQFQDASGRWVTIQHVQEDPKTFGVYSPQDDTTVDSYYSERSIFIHNFTPVVTSKIRLLVNATTIGGGATDLVKQAGGQTGQDQITLQEIEVYGN